MITISFLEEIDGEPTHSHQNDKILMARRCPSVNELGPRGPEYFMPRDAHVSLQLVEAPRQPAKRNPPAFSVIVNGMLLDKMRTDDNDYMAA